MVTDLPSFLFDLLLAGLATYPDTQAWAQVHRGEILADLRDALAPFLESAPVPVPAAAPVKRGRIPKPKKYTPRQAAARAREVLGYGWMGDLLHLLRQRFGGSEGFIVSQPDRSVPGTLMVCGVLIARGSDIEFHAYKGSRYVPTEPIWFLRARPVRVYHVPNYFYTQGTPFAGMTPGATIMVESPVGDFQDPHAMLPVEEDPNPLYEIWKGGHKFPEEADELWLAGVAGGADLYAENPYLIALEDSELLNLAKNQPTTDELRDAPVYAGIAVLAQDAVERKRNALVDEYRRAPLGQLFADFQEQFAAPSVAFDSLKFDAAERVLNDRIGEVPDPVILTKRELEEARRAFEVRYGERIIDKAILDRFLTAGLLESGARYGRSSPVLTLRGYASLQASERAKKAGKALPLTSNLGSESPTFFYGMPSRPPGYGNQPKGYTGELPPLAGDGERFSRFGVITYDALVPPSEVRDYNLVRILVRPEELAEYAEGVARKLASHFTGRRSIEDTEDMIRRDPSMLPETVGNILENDQGTWSVVPTRFYPTGGWDAFARDVWERTKRIALETREAASPVLADTLAPYRAMTDAQLAAEAARVSAGHPVATLYQARLHEYKVPIRQLDAPAFRAAWGLSEGAQAKREDPIRVKAFEDVAAEKWSVTRSADIPLPRAADSKEPIRREIRGLVARARALLPRLGKMDASALESEIPDEASIGNLNRLASDLEEMRDRLAGAIEEAERATPEMKRSLRHRADAMQSAADIEKAPNADPSSRHRAYLYQLAVDRVPVDDALFWQHSPHDWPSRDLADALRSRGIDAEDFHDWFQQERAVPAPGGKPYTIRPNPIYLTESPLLDAEGRKYRVQYVAVPTRYAGHGIGPVMTSNEPGSLLPVAAYPAAFQARNLQEPAEARKIAIIAESLDPDRLEWAHLDPTMGPPVAWKGTGEAGTSSDAWYVLGGNGRTLAILMASEDRYRGYLEAAREHWKGLIPEGEPPPGYRYVLIREVTHEDGSALTLNDAVRLAGASQRATAGEESMFGKALSTIRSLGIESVNDLPRFTWPPREAPAQGAIHPGNVREFVGMNPRFWGAIKARLDPAKVSGIEDRPDQLVGLILAIMVGYLPVDLIQVGFDDRKEAEALVAATPVFLMLHRDATDPATPPGDRIERKWDLWPHLADAARFARIVKARRLSLARVSVFLDEQARQVRIAGAETLMGTIQPLGAALGFAVKLASGQADPEASMGRYLAPYVSEATRAEGLSVQGTMFAPMMGGLFGSTPEPTRIGPEPAQVLAGATGLVLPETFMERARTIRENPAKRQPGPRPGDPLYETLRAQYTVMEQNRGVDAARPYAPWLRVALHWKHVTPGKWTKDPDFRWYELSRAGYAWLWGEREHESTRSEAAQARLF